jgi:hypothetical protein
VQAIKNLSTCSSSQLLAALEIELPSVVAALASALEQDEEFVPVIDGSERWHATIDGVAHEFIFRGASWYDCTHAVHGGSPSSLVMHLTGIRALEAISLLVGLSTCDELEADHGPH